MKKLLFGALFLLGLGLCVAPASADALVVTTCGTLPQAYSAGGTRLETVDVNGNTCTTPSAAASSTPQAISGAVNVTPTTCSGAITTGGTAQNAHAAVATLHGMTIQNDDTSEPLWFSITGVAAAGTAGSYVLPPATAVTFAGAASFTTPLGLGYNTALSVVAATTAHKFSCTRW